MSDDNNIIKTILTLVFTHTCTYRLVPESPRWLLSEGKKKQAERILRDIAKVNKKHYPEGFIEQLKEPDVKRENICGVFSSKVLLPRSLVVFFNWYARFNTLTNVNQSNILFNQFSFTQTL